MALTAAADAARMDAAARQAMASRDAAASRQAVAALLRAHPDYPPAWLTASLLALDLGEPARALEASQRGLRLLPADPALDLQRARAQAALGQRDQALAGALALIPRVAGAPRLQHWLAETLMTLDEHAPAETLLATAAAALPDDTRVGFNHATVLRFLGRFAAAEAVLDRVLARAPLDGEAQLLRSGLRTQTAAANHIGTLRALLDRAGLDWQTETRLRHALAKELEDTDAYADSFRELAAGAALRRAHLRYDVAEDVAALDRIATVFGAGWLAGCGAGLADAAPIFVFGLPRSGTTLVERILGRHALVQPLGELNDFPAAVIAATRAAHPAATGKLALIDAAALVAPEDIGAGYLARVARRRNAQPCFTDKLPGNTLYAGLIAAALPGARLVHVTRHPLANGYGMFRTLFQQGYPFSYDLNELGHYMAAHARLMAHWHQLLGPRLITLSYEALVADPERETRALLSACGLPWHPACLSPQASGAASTTQSAVQVRQPISTAMAAHWQHFATELEPLRQVLESQGGWGNNR